MSYHGGVRAILIFFVSVIVGGCGKVREIADAPADAAPLQAPVVAITSPAIAGGPVQCKVMSQPGGTAPFHYTATWTLDAIDFPGTTMTMFPGDTVPGSQTHTGSVFACTVTATDALGAVKTAEPVGAVIDGRFAFLINQTAPASLERINLDNNSVQSIGPIGVAYAFGDLAWNSKTQTLFMIDGRATKALYTLDTATGTATLVGVHNITDMFGLGFDPSSGKLLGSNQAGTLFSMDTQTGAATSIGGTQGLEGLAFDTKRNIMVGVNGPSGPPASLFNVNEGTGAATSLGTAGSVSDSGLTYDPFTDKVLVVDLLGNLFQYDPANNYAKTTPATGLGQLTAITIFIPPSM
jgi:hypothetical protein